MSNLLPAALVVTFFFPVFSLIVENRLDATNVPFAPPLQIPEARPLPLTRPTEGISVESNEKLTSAFFPSTGRFSALLNTGRNPPDAVILKFGLGKPEAKVASLNLTLIEVNPVRCTAFQLNPEFPYILKNDAWTRLAKVGQIECPTRKSGLLVQITESADFSSDEETGTQFSLWTVGSLSRPHPADGESLLKLSDTLSKDSGWKGSWFPQGWLEWNDTNLPRNRAELLAFLWDIPERFVTIWFWFWLSLAVICSFGLMRSALSGKTFGNSKVGMKSRSYRSVMAWSVCFLTCSTALQAILVPPLHGPDEPDHLLTFYAMDKSKSSSNDLLTLARHGHFESLKFRYDVPFTPDMAFAPADALFSKHIYPTEVDRSAIHLALWPRIFEIIERLPLSYGIFSLRLFHGALLLLTIALCLWCMNGSGGGALWIGTLLLLPTLPFFSTAFSNYPFLIYATLFLSAASFLCLMPAKKPVRLGLAIGIGMTMGPLSAMTGLPALPFGLALLALSPIWLSSSNHGIRMCARIILGAFAGAGITLSCLWSEAFVKERFLFASDRFMRATNLSAEVRSHVANVFNYQLDWLPIGIVLVFLIASLNGVISLLRKRFEQALSQRIGQWASAIYLLKITGVAFFLLSIAFAFSQVVWGHFLPVQNIEGALGADYTLLGYVKSVFLTFIHSFGLGSPDYYLTWTFFGGFGWLDALLSERQIENIKAVIGLGIIFSFYFAARRGKLAWGRPVILSFLIAVTLSMLAAGAYQKEINLHGRYMFLFYMPLFALSAFGSWRLSKCANLLHTQALSGRSRTAMSILSNWPFILVMTGIWAHTSAFSLLLSRYLQP